jgi:hypothetical protein
MKRTDLPATHPSNIATFERFFRNAASLDIDKEDLRRIDEFINTKIHDLLVIGVARAKAHNSPVILPMDLPVTKGLQQNIHEFRKLDTQIALEPILERMAKFPYLELEYAEDTERELPWIAGGIAVALAHVFRILDPELRNPMTEHWARAFRIFDETL